MQHENQPNFSAPAAKLCRESVTKIPSQGIFVLEMDGNFNVRVTVTDLAENSGNYKECAERTVGPRLKGLIVPSV